MLSRIVKTGLPLLLAASFGAGANDLMVTPTPNGTATEIKFEFVNDGNVSALEFELKLAGIGESQLDFSGCTAGIYTNHAGTCSFKNGVLTVIVFSPQNEALPTLELGSVKINAPVASISGLEVQRLAMADTKGNTVRGGRLLLDDSQVRGMLTNEQVSRFKAK